MRTPTIVAVTVALAGATIWPAAAAAQGGQAGPLRCGEEDPATGQVVRGALELDPDSVTQRSFGRSTGEEALALSYLVKGCDAPAEVGGVSLRLRPLKESSKGVPVSAVGLAGPGASADSVDFDPSTSTLTVSLLVTTAAEAFKPGTYGSQLEIRGPWLVTARSPITIARSENDAWQILLWGAFGGLLGVVFYALSAFAAKLTKHDSAELGKWWLVAATLAAGAAAGAFAAWGAWQQQEVWTWAENSKGTLTSAFIAGSAGVMLVLLGSVFGTPPKPGEPGGAPGAPRGRRPAAPSRRTGQRTVGTGG